MRVLFFGTAAFASPTLHALLASDEHDVVGIVTQPDRPSGRGLQLQQSAVKRAAVEFAPTIPIYQPEKARAKEFVAQVKEVSPDVLVVAAFGQILPQRLLDLPPFGGINVHGSLLPRWRGAAPMQYALIAGDAETGVTTMQMSAGLDTGDMLLKESTPITADDTIDSLEERLSKIGSALLIETLSALQRGDYPREVQDESFSTYAPSLPPDFGTINWEKPAASIANLIRGVTPRPGAWASFNGRKIKLLKAVAKDGVNLTKPDARPGEVLSVKQALIVAAGDGTSLALEALQPEGKPKMAAGDWARGARVQAGDLFR